MTTAESMAVAVLKGDLVAARALADSLVNECQQGGELVLPVRKLSVPAERLRVVLFAPEGAEFDEFATENAVRRWLTEGRPLALYGIDRVEVYELPEPTPPPAAPAGAAGGWAEGAPLIHLGRCGAHWRVTLGRGEDRHSLLHDTYEAAHVVFAALVNTMMAAKADEREACAREVDVALTLRDAAAAIRRRGQP